MPSPPSHPLPSDDDAATFPFPLALSRRVLVIAGSDSSGGAGLEADLRTLTLHGCYALTATTALTSQSTTSVADILPTPPAFLSSLLAHLFSDISIPVVKTGMLHSAATVRVVVDAVRRFGVRTVVVDPVMVSTSGARLLEESAIGEVRAGLLGVASVVTPNIPEARLLLELDEGGDGWALRDVGGLVALAEGVRRLMGTEGWVVLKGGHAAMNEGGRVVRDEEEGRVRVVDVLVGPGGRTQVFESRWVEGGNTHGTGCSLASAIAANLAQGKQMVDAVRAACGYVEAAIRTARGTRLGEGSGPINHFHCLRGGVTGWGEREDARERSKGQTE